ncbi:hypothetical protein BOTBODRAFT_56964 [Botryobasidium botryosum FD-172 SS1]|uniref:Uncharacterized protein n=1 Tax=Botryobasidium botryosum (strain FD-172 SS1) TaxID=930990 RepID=A0A067M941_BOTB1|nr:hypothetical protein BOTBODRAFT_56964 [Botryobasidium botryosum FD-172 SS1]
MRSPFRSRQGNAERAAAPSAHTKSFFSFFSRKTKRSSSAPPATEPIVPPADSKSPPDPSLVPTIIPPPSATLSDADVPKPSTPFSDNSESHSPPADATRPATPVAVTSTNTTVPLTHTITPSQALAQPTPTGIATSPAHITEFQPPSPADPSAPTTLPASGANPSSVGTAVSSFKNYHYLYELAESLKEGGDALVVTDDASPDDLSQRPPLPLPVVRHILFHAGLLDPNPRVLAQSTGPKSIASGGPRSSAIWFISPPLQRPIARMVLATSSHDQGWATHDGSWSWFDISILTPDDQVKVRHDGGECLWKSHSNRVASQHPVDLSSTFDLDHEIWKNLEEGDRIAVSVVAQYGGWANHAREGKLEIWEWASGTVTA